MGDFFWQNFQVVAENENGDRIPNLERPILEAFISGKPVFERIYYRRLDGSRVAVALTASPVLLDDKPIGAIEVFRDISEEIELEKSKDEFIALASHQLRTPATSVKQYAGMLMADFAGPLTPDQMDMMKKVYESNERQINIVNDLLRVAQIDAGKVSLSLADVELNSLLDDVVGEYRQKFAERAQKVELHLPEKAVWAHIDRERFRMALENLVDNASKYTPEEKHIAITLAEDTDNSIITIADQGVGIPKEDKQRIFQKFSRLDNPLSIKVGGTGLGLYWVEKILHLHQAEVRVDSKVGSGTKFTILIPKKV